MIISDNTERRSLKLTCCSCRKKAHETENLSAKERWNTKQNLHLSWSFLLPIVKPAIRHSLSFFFVVGLTDSITIQSISAWKTTIHTHRTLACEFNRPAISLWPIRMSSTLLPGLSHQFPAVSESRYHTRWSQRFTYDRLLWDIAEIFGLEDVEAVHFKKIIRV